MVLTDAKKGNRQFWGRLASICELSPPFPSGTCATCQSSKAERKSNKVQQRRKPPGTPKAAPTHLDGAYLGRGPPHGFQLVGTNNRVCRPSLVVITSSNFVSGFFPGLNSCWPQTRSSQKYQCLFNTSFPHACLDK